VAHIYRIVLLLFLSLFGSISFGAIEPKIYWRYSSITGDFLTIEGAVESFFIYRMKKYPNITSMKEIEGDYLGNYYNFKYEQCSSEGCFSRDENIQRVAKVSICPENSSIYIYNNSCRCNGGFFEQGEKCVNNKYKCPTGANWNEGAKACLCSDGLQSSGSSCTIPEIPSDKEDDYCKPSGVIKQLSFSPEDPRPTAICDLTCLY